MCSDTCVSSKYGVEGVVENSFGIWWEYSDDVSGGQFLSIEFSLDESVKHNITHILSIRNNKMGNQINKM